MPPGREQHHDERQTYEMDSKLAKLVEKNSEPGPYGLQTKIVWRNVFLISFLHVLAFVGLFSAPFCKWKSWIFFCIYDLVSGLGVTAGAHRLWAHRTYKAKLPYRIMLMLFNCISVQNHILEWSRDHRVHHKYAETDADPHNVKRGFFFAHVGWLLMRKHPQVLLKGSNVDMTDVQEDPVVQFQCRHYLKLCLVFSVLVPTIVPWLCWGEDPINALMFLVFLRYVYSLHVTWLVNSAAHLWGKRPYDKSMNPAENLFVSVAAIGEGFHNYHHTFPYDYATSEWGPSLNITTCFIDLFAAVGWVYERKQVSQEAISRVKKRKGGLVD